LEPPELAQRLESVTLPTVGFTGEQCPIDLSLTTDKLHVEFAPEL
jgi:hypothetical protein